MFRYGYTRLRSGRFDRHSPLSAIASGGTAGFERGEAFADVDRGPQLPVDAVDPDIDPPDLGDQLGPERIDLGREPDIQVVDLRREPGIQAIDLLVQSVDLHRESSIDPVDLPIKGVDLLVQHTDVGPHRVHVAPDRVELRSDEVLERLLDLVVDTHAWHFIRPRSARQRPDQDTPGPGDLGRRDVKGEGPTRSSSASGG